MSALFSILESRGMISGADVLDLFSGTGAVARIALERGAARAVAVEQDWDAAALIKSSLERFGDRARVVRADVRRALRTFAGERFRVVFADPPYGIGWGDELPPLVVGSGVVAEGGAFIFERSSREEPAEISTPRDDRRYGETVLSIFWA